MPLSLKKNQRRKFKMNREIKHNTSLGLQTPTKKQSGSVCEILFENEDFVAINKPAGLLTVPDREQKEISLKEILNNKYGKIFTVHRLDRDTSGVIVFAKNEAAHKYLSQLFEGREVQKFYLGLVNGSIPNKSGTIDASITEHSYIKGKMVVHRKGKQSVTDYEVLEDFGLFSWVKFQIHTGRTHQIRVHIQYIGHAIVCDEIYGDGNPVLLSSFKKKFHLSQKEEEERPILNRLALHSHQLIFKDANGNEISITAEPPKDLRALLNQLRKWKK
ncbi:MAG TPA: RluA family pseudouridine synthase [Chitinophagaceae bacterium]|nr:RluA family pseudouridine synthase [Chitinophagaceae bacterium]